MKVYNQGRNNIISGYNIKISEMQFLGMGPNLKKVNPTEIIEKLFQNIITDSNSDYNKPWYSENSYYKSFLTKMRYADYDLINIYNSILPVLVSSKYLFNKFSAPVCNIASHSEVFPDIKINNHDNIYKVYDNLSKDDKVLFNVASIMLSLGNNFSSFNGNFDKVSLIDGGRNQEFIDNIKYKLKKFGTIDAPLPYNTSESFGEYYYKWQYYLTLIDGKDPIRIQSYVHELIRDVRRVLSKYNMNSFYSNEISEYQIRSKINKIKEENISDFINDLDTKIGMTILLIMTVNRAIKMI